MTIDVHQLDPFTTIYRSPGGKSSESRRKACFHLRSTCPMLSPRILKGRLASALISGRVLCDYEDKFDTLHPNRQTIEATQ
jgi:hypothetical protein